jgi:hypothetical protein
MLKYSVSDALSTQMEKDIDDLVERAAFNESQKTFQQMSQKDALQPGEFTLTCLNSDFGALPSFKSANSCREVTLELELSPTSLAIVSKMAAQKMLKYSVSDGLSTQMEKDIDDLVERAAFNESQKTFQQMSQKDAVDSSKVNSIVLISLIM